MILGVRGNAAMYQYLVPVAMVPLLTPLKVITSSYSLSSPPRAPVFRDVGGHVQVLADDCDRRLLQVVPAKMHAGNAVRVRVCAIPHARCAMLRTHGTAFPPLGVLSARASRQSGQIVIWDTRSKSTPVQRSPLCSDGRGGRPECARRWELEK